MLSESPERLGARTNCPMPMRIRGQGSAAYPRYAVAYPTGVLKAESEPRQACADLQTAIAYDSNDGARAISLWLSDNPLGQFDDAVRMLDHGIAIAPIRGRVITNASRRWGKVISKQRCGWGREGVSSLVRRSFRSTHLVKG